MLQIPYYLDCQFLLLFVIIVYIKKEFCLQDSPPESSGYLQFEAGDLLDSVKSGYTERLIL